MFLKDIRNELNEMKSNQHAEVLQRFFKTGPGEYGEGDIFIGVKVPPLRKLARKYQALSHQKTLQLLRSRIHEERMLALLIFLSRFSKGNDQIRENIYQSYLENTSFINNWDLVDISAQYILGAFLLDRDKKPLYRLAQSSDLWERRMAIMSTFYFIRQNRFSDTLKIARQLRHDPEDLIHKAVGWMLREIGKRNMPTEEKFLKRHYPSMPRTMLRYAIEKFPEKKRKAYLKGTM
jgi:3-methyladenine DNA glycosylase AlkD